MRALRPLLFAAAVVALGVHGVWAVEGDIIFERLDRPAPSEADADGAQPSEDDEEEAAEDDEEPEGKRDEDVAPEAASKFYPPAFFPHWVHIIRFRCFVCHPRLYRMEIGPPLPSGREHHNEKSCGRCHNGAIGFEISFALCGHCHLSRDEAEED